MPSSNIQDIEVSDKLIHFVFYAVFSFFLFLFSYNVNFGLDTLIKKWTFVFSIGTLLGFIIEWIQYVLIPSRSDERYNSISAIFLKISSNLSSCLSDLNMSYSMNPILFSWSARFL